jgi:hypothetical protein
MKSTHTALKTVLASSVFLGMAFGPAKAEVCFQLTPFIDVIRLAETFTLDEFNGGSHRQLTGNWFVPGTYSLPVTGSEDLAVGSTSTRITLHGSNNSADFGGNTDCQLDIVDNGGTFVPGNFLACDNGVPGIFTNGVGSITMTPIFCTSIIPGGPAPTGKMAGKK